MPRDQRSPCIAPIGRPAACALCDMRSVVCDDLTRLDLSRGAATVLFSRGAPILHADTPADCAWIVKSGAVKATQSRGNGQSGIIALMLPGDSFGLERNGRYLFGAVASRDASICVVPRTKFQRALATLSTRTDPAPLAATHELIATQDRLRLLARRSPQERLARYLLWVDRKSPARADGRVDMPLDWCDVADFLGIDLATIRVALRTLRRVGMMTWDGGDRSVTLPDRRMLTEIAG